MELDICKLKGGENSSPVTQPLIYEWPDDASVVDCDDEYLFVDGLLIALLLEESAESRTVHLTAGEWIEFFTHEKHDGRQRDRAGGNGKLPVFVRAGCESLLSISIYD